MKNIAPSKRTSLWPISLVILAAFAFIGIGVQLSTTRSSAAGDERVEGAPQYQIFDLGVVQTGDTASQGFGVSIAASRSGDRSGPEGRRLLAGLRAADAWRCRILLDAILRSQTRQMTTAS